jgi:ATP-dependent DNA helicase RecG
MGLIVSLFHGSLLAPTSARMALGLIRTGRSMTPMQLEYLLQDLRRLPHETEWVEFKEAKQGYDFGKLGEYVSALANEANLKNRSCAWLVFGVRDHDRAIVGSRFRQSVSDLDRLKQEVAAQMNGGFTFLDIHILEHADGRVVLFQIPPAPRGVPIAWQGHWYGRNGGSIAPLALHELEAIRAQRLAEDWSAAICAGRMSTLARHFC